MCCHGEFFAAFGCSALAAGYLYRGFELCRHFLRYLVDFIAHYDAVLRKVSIASTNTDDCSGRQSGIAGYRHSRGCCNTVPFFILIGRSA